MRLLIMGAPGAGKGTQAKGIAARYRIPTISTGDIFRANIKNETELGRQVEAIIQAGDYVPDELTEEIVRERLSQEDAVGGFLLDGFPRTMHQVEALDAFLTGRSESLDAVISLVVDPDVLVARLTKRAAIEGRADDNEETIRHRMKRYLADTQPLLDHYADHDLLVAVDGNGAVEEVNGRIFEALDTKLS